MVNPDEASMDIQQNEESKVLEPAERRKPVRKWEKRWVLMPNVIEQGSEIWIQKWVCVDDLEQVVLPPSSFVTTADCI
jgi:hypothetical protein